MEEMLNEIKGALDARLFYIAVSSTLCLPDVCAALESPNGQTSARRYKRFWQTYVTNEGLRNMEPEDVYALRCAIVHQRRFTHDQMSWRRVIFTVPFEPGENGSVAIHNLAMVGSDNQSAMIYDANLFCRFVADDVERWYAARHNQEPVASNLNYLVRYRRSGMIPFLANVPVIA